jgi:hypothetical protein
MKPRPQLMQLMRRMLETAYQIFGSTTNTQMAEVMLLLVLAMIAWALVVIPGDQTAGGLEAIIRWWLQ